PANVSTGSISKPAGVSLGSTSACEPYRDYIAKAIEQGLTAQRIWQDLREEYGFGYCYASVKRFVRRVKKRRPEVAGVMEHPPGREAQVDFVQGPPTLHPTEGRWRRPWILRVTLSCSRHGYEEAIWTQDRVHFLRAIEHAFLDFGGVPEVLRHDNLKAAIVRACLYDPDVSDLYAAFARHWGFVPLPARPRHPEEDGIVENSGGYVKDNAVKGKRFDSLEELNAHLGRWNRTIARLRIHGTTRKQVYTHFLEVDKPALKPLAQECFNLFNVGTRTVHPDGHVQIMALITRCPTLSLARMSGCNGTSDSCGSTPMASAWPSIPARRRAPSPRATNTARLISRPGKKLTWPGCWPKRSTSAPAHWTGRRRPARREAYGLTGCSRACYP
ncbi:MAG: IS21 family transposase, partial [Chloroflexota bacterium]